MSLRSTLVICFMALLMPYLTKIYAQESLHAVTDFQQPKSFIENKGQFDGRNWQPSKIEYAVDYNGINIFFTKEGLTYRLDRFIRNPGRCPQRRHEPKRICFSELASVSWLGANKNVELIPLDKLQSYYSYAYYDRKNDDEVLNENFIPGYKRLIYKNLYDKIDVEYIIHKGKGIKYNLYLQAGADASQIKMKYEGHHTTNGAESVNIELTNDGKIQIIGSLFEITELSPIAFYGDTEEAVGISFTYDNGIVGFDIEPYDKSRPLVIDPWILSPTFNTSSAVWEVETDAAGNVYVIGGETPMRLNKYNSAGTLQWSYTTPWDTAGYWLGTLATDYLGTSYVTAGTAPRIQRISTAGTMVWNNSGPNASCEYWSITFNCDNTKLIVGGTYNPFPLSMDYSSVVYNMDINNGSILGFQTFDTTNVMGFGTTPVEIRGISSSKNAKYNFLTHNSVGLITQNIGLCPTSVPLYKVPLNYTLGYKCENYLPTTQNGGGLKAIISNDNFVYTHSGNQIHRRDLSTGALIASVNIPGGQSSTTLGLLVVRNSGLDVDDCGNVYAGSMDRVVKFDQNLNILAQETTGFAVYDVSVNTNGEVVAVGAVHNNSATNRDGKIRSINMNCCAQYDPSCCDATICPINPVCHDDPAFNLIANSPGGTWSGTGITSTTNGTFNPSVSGHGTFWVHYTLPCGTDSVLVTVNLCVPLQVCAESNGDITVTNGVGPYSWANHQPAGTTPITNQAECVACGYTWMGFPLNECLDNMMPVTTCSSPAQWVQFATGSTITPSGTYPVQVTDSQGNTATINSFASLPDCLPCAPLTITPSNITHVLCFGDNNGSFNVTVSGGTAPYNYTLTQGGNTVATLTGVTGPQSFTGLSGGTYNLSITDADNCPGSTTVTINQPAAALSAGTPSVVDANCGQTDGSATVNPTGGTPSYTYNWNTTPAQTTQTATNIPGGTYTVSITDNNGCTTTATATVGNTGAPTLQTSVTEASCGQANGSATVTASGGSGNYTYIWSTTPPQTTQTANNLAAGTYSVTVDDGLCPASASVTINDISTPIYDSIHSILEAHCNNPTGGATVTATGGTPPYTYAWSTTPPQTTAVLQNVPQGTYTVTITDNLGCSTTASVTIGGTPAPVLSISATNENCGQGDGSVTVNATGGTGNYTYQWSNGATTASISNLSAGTYSVTVNDGNCNSFISATITNTPGPTAAFSYAPQSVTTDNANVNFNDNSMGNISSWYWSFGDGSYSNAAGNVSHEYSNEGTFEIILVVTDIYGCSDTAKGTVTVSEPFSFYIPNTFTPDGDGINDYFQGYGTNIAEFEMFIFTRWGEMIYHTDDYNRPWNGTKNNNGGIEDTVMDVYAYRIIVKTLNGITHSFLGSVTLIK